MQFGTAGCASSCGSSGGAVTIAPGACASVQTITTACGVGASLTVSGSAAAGGTCQPDASVALPQATWGTQAIACVPSALSPVGCPSGETCVPVTSTAFGSRFCVLRAGTNGCPAGPFVAQHLYYGAVADTRACSACSCGGPTGVDCNSKGHATTWGNPTCTMNLGADLTPLPVACVAAAAAHSIQFTTTPDGGSCAPGGGLPSGGVTAQAITTLCCTP